MYKDEKQGVDNFYKTPLGKIFSRHLMLTINQLLGDVSGRNILVIGPAIPDMVQLALRCRNIQYKTLKGTSVFPFSDDSFARVIVLHSLEFSEHITGFLREVWRVTEPEGKAIFVVPNRLGLLVRSDRTPFGFGQPYTKNQFKTLLVDNLFSSQEFCEVLCMPVWSLSRKPSVITFMDKMGQLLWPQLCGAFVVDAGKSVYAPELQGENAKATLAPATAPY